MRISAALLLIGFSVMPSAHGQSSIYSKALPPTAATLDSINLTTQWTTVVPVGGRSDSVGLVQVVPGGQIFVQTIAGLLVAIDERTGAQQWTLKYDSSNATIYPIGVNSRFVFAVNVLKIYCIQRYTGTVEFSYSLPLIPTSGPTADDTGFYLILNSQRIAAFDLPSAIAVPDKALAALKAKGGSIVNDPKTRNPANIVADRYPSGARKSLFAEDRFEETKITLATAEPSGNISQRTPSLSVLPTMQPPYRLYDDKGRYLNKTESVGLAYSLRQPYSFKDPATGQIQRTPSLSTMPSMAAVAEKTNLRERGLEPQLRWAFGSSIRLAYQPLTTRSRVWVTSDTPAILALQKENNVPQVDAKMPDAATAASAQADDVAYIPLDGGNLLALDLTSGGNATLRPVWRANVGGVLTRSPLATNNGIFQPSEGSGVARIDPKTGEVTWRTLSTDDYLLAVNDERAYVRDRLGRVHVYDRTRVADSVTKRAVALSSIDLGEFRIPTMNEQTDRIFLASDNGLIVCLRDKAPKYNVPMTVAPPLHKPLLDLQKKPDAAAPTAAEPAPAPKTP